MMLLVKLRNLPRFLKESKVLMKASKVLMKASKVLMKAMLTSQSVAQYGKVWHVKPQIALRHTHPVAKTLTV